MSNVCQSNIPTGCYPVAVNERKTLILTSKILHLEAVDGPDAADADLLRLIRWEARGKPVTQFFHLLIIKISCSFIGDHTQIKRMKGCTIDRYT